jgi:hypothetical protein
LRASTLSLFRSFWRSDLSSRTWRMRLLMPLQSNFPRLTSSWYPRLGLNILCGIEGKPGAKALILWNFVTWWNGRYLQCLDLFLLLGRCNSRNSHLVYLYDLVM